MIFLIVFYIYTAKNQHILGGDFPLRDRILEELSEDEILEDLIDFIEFALSNLLNELN